MATENKNLSNYDKSTLPNVSQKTFGIVVSEWNETITENLYKGAYDTLIDCGVLAENIVTYHVPGSFELIYGASKMMQDHPLLDGIITIGCVIQGETKHFDFVCEGVTQGIKDLNLMAQMPVIFCVLTDNTLQQSIDRSGGKHGNKGVEAAVAAIKMSAL
jgi:6,7-dimethyl-8-ribityllumazine synthase